MVDSLWDRWDPHGSIPREEVARREGATEADVEHFIAVVDGRATGLPRIVRRHRIIYRCEKRCAL